MGNNIKSTNQMDIYERVFKEAKRLNPDNLKEGFFENPTDHNEYHKKFDQLISAMDSYYIFQKAALNQLSKCIDLALELDILYALNHKK